MSAVLLAALAAAAWGFAEPTGFQNLPFGADMPAMLKLFPNAACTPMDQGGAAQDVICSTPAHLDAVPVDAFLVMVGAPGARRFMSVNLRFDSAQYDTVRRGMVVRYGPPHASDSASTYWSGASTFVQILRSGTSSFMGVLKAEPSGYGIAVLSTYRFLQLASERKREGAQEPQSKGRGRRREDEK